MTVATKFLSWQNGRQPGTPYTYCSPSLKKIGDYCIDRWKLTNLGCYAKRPIRGGTSWSSHAFGAAIDLGYTDRTVLEREILPFLIANSEQLGIQRIHDYIEKRYWQAGKGWILRPPGNSIGAWIHVETYWANWDDGRTVGERVDSVPAPDTPPPPYPGKPLKEGATGPNVKLIQEVVGAKQDGIFGPITEGRVVNWQAAHALEPDGIVGKRTWTAMFPA
jgi:hypothetical protein